MHVEKSPGKNARTVQQGGGCAITPVQREGHIEEQSPYDCIITYEIGNNKAWCRSLRGQTIAPRLGHKKRNIRRIGFDLLTQAIDMCLQRMRRDAGIIAPDLVQ